MNQNDPKKYCVYLNNWPYINNMGRIGMCCKNNTTQVNPPFQTIINTSLTELWENAHLLYQVESMKSGNIPKGCDICYNDENAVDFTNSFRNRSLKGLLKSENLYPYTDRKIRALDLRVGSTCNLACVMCHPSDSSKWFSIYENYHNAMQFNDDSRLKNVKKQYKPSLLNWAEYESSWENIFNSLDENLIRVYMAGGEPFYIKNFPDYIVQLVRKLPNLTVDINTNGTCFLSDKHINNLTNKLNLRISIDGYKESEEYQRLGTSWEEKIRVIDQYVKYFNIKSFDLTITSLTIRQLPELMTFISNRYPGIQIMLRPVVNREGLAVNDIPLSMRQNTIDFLINSIENKIFNTHNHEQFLHHLRSPYKSSTKNMLIKTVKHWDSICTVRLSDYDQELSEWVYNNE